MAVIESEIAALIGAAVDVGSFNSDIAVVGLFIVLI